MTEQASPSATEQQATLRTFADRCALMAEMATALVGPGTAEPFAQGASEAERLLSDGFTDADLVRLGRTFPEQPGSFDPAALSSTGSVSEAEEELAEVRDEVAQAAQVLRGLGG